MVSIASNLSMIAIVGGLVLMQIIPFGFEIAVAGVILFGVGITEIDCPFLWVVMIRQ